MNVGGVSELFEVIRRGRAAKLGRFRLGLGYEGGSGISVCPSSAYRVLGTA
jgi:hypothetical protein